MRADQEGKFLASTKRDAAFLSKGFTYLKEATTAFHKHQSSQCHREANEALIVLPKQTCDVGELLSREHQGEKVTNRRMLQGSPKYQVSRPPRSATERGS